MLFAVNLFEGVHQPTLSGNAMKKFTALLLSVSLALSSVAFAQTQSGAAGGAGSAGATGAAGAGAGAAGAAAGAAAGVSVGVAAAVAAGVAVAAAVAANKSDPVYTTTGTGTNTSKVCTANC